MVLFNLLIIGLWHVAICRKTQSPRKVCLFNALLERLVPAFYFRTENEGKIYAGSSQACNITESTPMFLELTTRGQQRTIQRKNLKCIMIEHQSPDSSLCTAVCVFCIFWYLSIRTIISFFSNRPTVARLLYRKTRASFRTLSVGLDPPWLSDLFPSGTDADCSVRLWRKYHQIFPFTKCWGLV